MLTAMMTLLLGVGLTFLGLLQPAMYDIGLVVVLIGGVGVVVALGDRLVRLRR